MNKDILEEVKTFIRAESERFDMGDFVSSCGTTACIAGWICLLNGETESWVQEYAYQTPGVVEKALELIGAEEDDLFFTVNWPKDLHDAYHATTTPEAQAEVACSAIDRFAVDPKSFSSGVIYPRRTVN